MEEVYIEYNGRKISSKNSLITGTIRIYSEWIKITTLMGTIAGLAIGVATPIILPLFFILRYKKSS